MFARTLIIYIIALVTALAGLFTTAGLISQPAPTQAATPSALPTYSPTAAPLIFPTPTSEAEPTDQAEPTFEAEPTLAPIVITEEAPVTQPTPTEEAVSEQIPPRNMDINILPMDEDYHSQLTETSLPNACGPTSLLMVLDYFGLEQSLDVVIAYHQAIPAEQGGYDPSCTKNGVCTSPGALVQVAQSVYGLSVDARHGWTFEDVQAALLAGNPIIADINWRLVPGNFGHFVVIYGVDAATGTIFYHDPYDGSQRSASWTQFYAAWNGPIDVGDPLQPEGHRLWGMAVIAQ